jgi:tetratricopeptide (TPR) repeat protein
MTHSPSLPPGSDPTSDPPPALLDDKAEQLMQQAFSLLQRGRYDEALDLALELKFLHHASCFDIMAEAYLGRGQADQALQALREGVRVVPKAWLLWQSLGNLLTQMGDFASAHEAYGRALVCPHADRGVLHFNRALAHAQAQSFTEALACLDLVDGAHMRLKAAGIRLALLNDLKRYHEVAALAESVTAQLPVEPDPGDLALVYAQWALACWKGDAQAEQARAHATFALSLNPDESVASGLLRALPQLAEQPGISS